MNELNNDHLVFALLYNTCISLKTNNKSKSIKTIFVENRKRLVATSSRAKHHSEYLKVFDAVLKLQR